MESHIGYGWCCCHCGLWNSHLGWNGFKIMADVVSFVADGMVTGLTVCICLLPHPQHLTILTSLVTILL